MAGALVGAWLGFNATADLKALLTTIVGATAGANLAVILIDVARERSARARRARSEATSSQFEAAAEPS
jgi:ethanolamine transporter EutH